jgi:hypothetical protein
LRRPPLEGVVMIVRGVKKTPDGISESWLSGTDVKMINCLPSESPGATLMNTSYVRVAHPGWRGSRLSFSCENLTLLLADYFVRFLDGSWSLFLETPMKLDHSLSIWWNMHCFKALNFLKYEPRSNKCYLY